MNLHDRDITRAAKREGIAEGLLQGAAEAKIEAARNFYANGISQEIISKSLDLPLSKVSEILGQTTTISSGGRADCKNNGTSA